jgi:antitoxin VapB
MQKAKIFKNGSSQAVRLPREFRFKGKEVYIEKTPRGVLLSEEDPWDSFLEAAKQLSDDFMTERRQPKVQKRKGLDDL